METGCRLERSSATWAIRAMRRHPALTCTSRSTSRAGGTRSTRRRRSRRRWPDGRAEIAAELGLKGWSSGQLFENGDPAFISAGSLDNTARHLDLSPASRTVRHNSFDIKVSLPYDRPLALWPSNLQRGTAVIAGQA